MNTDEPGGHYASDRSQTERDKSRIISLTRGIFHRNSAEGWLPGAKGYHLSAARRVSFEDPKCSLVTVVTTQY